MTAVDVACPKCHAPVGAPCAKVDARTTGGGGYAEMRVKVGRGEESTSYFRIGALLKHPHRDRLEDPS